MKPVRTYGFTLIEVLVVILILGMMAGIVFPRVIERAEKAKVEKCRIQIRALANALENYHFDNGGYPSTEQGMEALISPPTVNKPMPNYQRGGYLQSTGVPRDAWGRPFVYLSPADKNKQYDVISYGRDGKPGGEGLDQDLSIWDVADAEH